MRVAQPAGSRRTSTCQKPSATKSRPLTPSNRGFPALDPLVALAVAIGPRSGAELSIVSIHDGEIGDPVTWAAEPPRPSAPHQGQASYSFAAVADDIAAHLGTAAVVVHDAQRILGLLSELLPRWQPTTVLDLQILSQHRAIGATGRPTPIDPSLKPGLSRCSPRGGSACRALSTAHRFVQFVEALEP